MPTVALLGGSFCPVHSGHIMVASYLAQFVDAIDEVWIVPAASNPLKKDAYALTDAQRLRLLEIAVEGYRRIRVCDVEMNMPRPSYTVNTLRRLEADFPDCRFMWAMGSDNWQTVDRWYRWEEIVSRGVVVYPRPGYEIDAKSIPEGSIYVEAPRIELSSTFIRRGIAEGRDMRAFLPAGVWPLLNDFFVNAR